MIFYWIIGYLAGSLPFALWITHLVKGVDVRDGGSGHVTTTNTIRQAGFAPGAAVLLLDISKGFLLIVLSVATSIDALAVGLTFAFIEINIIPASLIIGFVAFILTGVGFALGKKIGHLIGKRAEVVGGIILIGIGFRILLSHIL